MARKSGKPMRKEYEDGDERIATFRISHGKLTAFQDACEKRGLSMSESLHAYIDQVLGGGGFIEPVDPVEQRFSEMGEAIAQLSQQVEELKKLELVG